MKLTGTEHRRLRARGHHLTPALIIGRAGLSTEVLEAIEQALDHQELIKLKVGKGPLTRKEVAGQLPALTGGVVVQVLGRTILLFRKQRPPTAKDFEPEMDESEAPLMDEALAQLTNDDGRDT